MSAESKHPPFAVTADVVVLAGQGEKLSVLLITRGSEPFAGRLALPGGFVDIDEELPDAARRELREETGVELADVPLVQLGAYGSPQRDPRMRTVSVAFLMLVPAPVEAAGADDATDAGWYPVTDLLADPDRLAFDHGLILRDAVDASQARFPAG